MVEAGTSPDCLAPEHKLTTIMLYLLPLGGKCTVPKNLLQAFFSYLDLKVMFKFPKIVEITSIITEMDTLLQESTLLYQYNLL